jgi:hypothetical protein
MDTEIFDLFEKSSKAVEESRRKIADIDIEIKRWKTGKAQSYYELYNIPTEYGGGLSAMRDWVIDYLEVKKSGIQAELVEYKEKAIDKLRERICA